MKLFIFFEIIFFSSLTFAGHNYTQCANPTGNLLVEINFNKVESVINKIDGKIQEYDLKTIDVKFENKHLITDFTDCCPSSQCGGSGVESWQRWYSVYISIKNKSGKYELSDHLICHNDGAWQGCTGPL